MITPIERIQARLEARFPGLPDVSAKVLERVKYFAPDWPDWQVARAAYLRELVRAGVEYSLAVDASIQVHLEVIGWRKGRVC